MNRIIIFLALLVTSSFPILAQDVEGCKDHPLFTRLPNFFIAECTSNFDRVDFLTAAGEDTIIEGNATYISYTLDYESIGKGPSAFQIVKNYANAVKNSGGKKIYEDARCGYYVLIKNKKEYRIRISDIGNDGGDGQTVFRLYVVEMESMNQEITANEMLMALNKNGYIALNILFDTGKSVIQEGSLSIVEQIVALMKSDAALKISIEGHTDNAGNADENKKLSTERAKAVMDAVIAKGVDKSRLSFIGWGQEKPVSDNRTDEGKALNRRVEIVKK